MLAWLNVFRLCTFLRLLGHFMVVVVLGIVGFVYYTVVVKTLGPIMSCEDKPLGATAAGVLAGVYSLIVFLLLWSYFATVLTDPGSVPDHWHPFIDETVAEEQLQRWMQFGDCLYDHGDPHRPRYCKKCHSWKPQRAHHCSVSRRCVLKMDHYCIWVVNCVGLLNYKFFMLFLMYTWTASVISLCLLVASMIDYFKNTSGRIPLVFLSFLLNAAFALSLLGFIFMHLKLILSNCTSIEMYEKQRIDPWPYDRGRRGNLKEVFGDIQWFRFLPFHTESERQRLLDSVLSPRLIVENRSSFEDV